MRTPDKAERRAGKDFTPMKFARVPTPGMKQPCIVPTSHKAHPNGYVYIVPRKRCKQMTARYQRLHRLAYLRKFGPDAIPPGYEVDHICRNGACCNVAHLRVLSRIDHIKVTALMARLERMEAVWPIWEHAGRPGGAVTCSPEM